MWEINWGTLTAYSSLQEKVQVQESLVQEELADWKVVEEGLCPMVQEQVLEQVQEQKQHVS